MSVLRGQGQGVGAFPSTDSVHVDYNSFYDTLITHRGELFGPGSYIIWKTTQDGAFSSIYTAPGVNKIASLTINQSNGDLFLLDRTSPVSVYQINGDTGAAVSNTTTTLGLGSGPETVIKGAVATSPTGSVLLLLDLNRDIHLFSLSPGMTSIGVQTDVFPSAGATLNYLEIAAIAPVGNERRWLCITRGNPGATGITFTILGQTGGGAASVVSQTTVAFASIWADITSSPSTMSFHLDRGRNKILAVARETGVGLDNKHTAFIDASTYAVVWYKRLLSAVSAHNSAYGFSLVKYNTFPDAESILDEVVTAGVCSIVTLDTGSVRNLMEVGPQTAFPLNSEVLYYGKNTYGMPVNNTLFSMLYEGAFVQFDPATPPNPELELVTGGQAVITVTPQSSVPFSYDVNIVRIPLYEAEATFAPSTLTFASTASQFTTLTATVAGYGYYTHEIIDNTLPFTGPVVVGRDALGILPYNDGSEIGLHVVDACVAVNASGPTSDQTASGLVLIQARSAWIANLDSVLETPCTWDAYVEANIAPGITSYVIPDSLLGPFYFFADVATNLPPALQGVFQGWDTATLCAEYGVCSVPTEDTVVSIDATLQSSPADGCKGFVVRYRTGEELGASRFVRVRVNGNPVGYTTPVEIALNNTIYNIPVRVGIVGGVYTVDVQTPFVET